MFFNRGVASSQAYARKFGNLRPDQQPTPEDEQKAHDWLARDLDDALIAFIDQAKKGDELRGCFYEFRYAPALERLRAAIGRGVSVHLIVDLKQNGTKSEPAFPRNVNRKALKAADIPDTAIIPRLARPSAIAHNKFMVLLTGKTHIPRQVWTESTNLSEGGVEGQSNVGHWVRDRQVAAAFAAYWDLLASDPGGRKGDERKTTTRKNKEFREAVAALTTLPPSVDDIPGGATPVFSPRTGTLPLALYGHLVDDADRLACITFAFGIPGPFRDLLKDNDASSPLCFLLLEKEDRPPKTKKVAPGAPPPPVAWVALRARNNVYMAFGSENR